MVLLISFLWFPVARSVLDQWRLTSSTWAGFLWVWILVNNIIVIICDSVRSLVCCSDHARASSGIGSHHRGAPPLLIEFVFHGGDFACREQVFVGFQSLQHQLTAVMSPENTLELFKEKKIVNFELWFVFWCYFLCVLEELRERISVREFLPLLRKIAPPSGTDSAESSSLAMGGRPESSLHQFHAT